MTFFFKPLKAGDLAGGRSSAWQPPASTRPGLCLSLFLKMQPEQNPCHEPFREQRFF